MTTTMAGLSVEADTVTRNKNSIGIGNDSGAIYELETITTTTHRR